MSDSFLANGASKKPPTQTAMSVDKVKYNQYVPFSVISSQYRISIPEGQFLHNIFGGKNEEKKKRNLRALKGLSDA